MDVFVAAVAEQWSGPAVGAAGGALAAALLWKAAHWRHGLTMPLRFLAAVAGTWFAVCLAYLLLRPEMTFTEYLLTGTGVTEIVALAGAAIYIGGLIRARPAERPWRRSSALVTGVALMGSAFVRAAYQPQIALAIQAPLALLLIGSVWRLRAEPLVYLSILGLAATIILGVRNTLAPGSTTPEVAWITSTAAGVSLAMVMVASALGLKKQQEFNVRWYRQGLLIVPLVVASLAAMGAGYVAIWHGTSWHTAWALGVWWAVLLVSAIGLRQPDLFGFSCIGAVLAAVAAFAVLGGDRVEGYWGTYPSVLLAIALGAAVLASLLKPVLKREPAAGFPQALYLAGASVALAALAIEPFGTSAKYVGIHLMLAAVVLVLAHAHGAPAWVNYLVAALATGGAAALANLGTTVRDAAWHHRFIRVTSAAAVLWLVAAIVLREILKRTASDRTARRQTQPLTVVGMVITLVLAGVLAFQQVRTYYEFLTAGSSTTIALLGPLWGLVGWLAVLLAFLLSMWLLRHTARTFLFYCVGIMGTIYLGLFRHTDDLYGYLLCAIAGYGSAHLVVYLYEAKFMDLLSRTCALYRDERRASTTIFTLAVISCFVAAILAAFRLSDTRSLIMLGLMAAVFLGWSFVWLRGEMLYPAVFMLTLTVLAIWHNNVRPVRWDSYRINVNAVIMAVSALVWLGIGNRLHAMRSEIFQLAAPARACSVVLGMLATGFAVALALSPTFGAGVWRQSRTLGDWALGLGALAAIILYFAWAALVFQRRFYSLMSALGVLLLGLYVGIYVGVRL